MKNLVQLTLVVTISFITMSLTAQAQKKAYVPAYIRDTSTIEGRQFSWDKTAQSENFFLIWGDAVGTKPAEYSDPNLRFDPRQILDTMEYIFRRCDELGMIHDEPGTQASKYKYVIVMYNTYGQGGPEGWANGWAVDDTIGAFWVHPNATRDGGVIAHEFTHSLQAMYHIDDQNSQRGAKAIYDNDGLFYETHANYVRNVLYPGAVSSDIDAHHYLMLEPDWKFNYEGYHFLFHIHSTLGLPMVSRLWTEWRPLEYPLQTLRRITAMPQSEFNDYMYQYATRAVAWDYPTNNWGAFLRESRRIRLREPWGRVFAQRTYDVLTAIDTAGGRYYSGTYMAPQDYGYNVVRLYPTDRSSPVVVGMIGHTEVNDHAGWRYGFVTVDSQGVTVRRSPTYSQPRATVQYTLEPNEAELYFVVLGAPVDSMHANPALNNTWNGNPKRYHYPYEVRLTNARPEGYQDVDLVRPWLRTQPGHRHANGGGWVDNRSVVDSSVFIGPRSIIAGTSRITGNVRIDGYNYVENATLSGSVHITDNAFVIGGTLTDSARVRHQCFVSNCTVSGNADLRGSAMPSNYKLGGTVRVDGDLVVYNDKGECNTGEYHVLTQYYRNELLPCDDRDSSHPENVSVNRPLIFDVVSVDGASTEINRATVAPNPVVGSTVMIDWTGIGASIDRICLFDAAGRQQRCEPTDNSSRAVVDVADLPPGMYMLRLSAMGRVVAVQTFFTTK